jgi:hypothetical protein
MKRKEPLIKTDIRSVFKCEESPAELTGYKWEAYKSKPRVVKLFSPCWNHRRARSFFAKGRQLYDCVEEPDPEWHDGDGIDYNRTELPLSRSKMLHIIFYPYPRTSPCISRQIHLVRREGIYRDTGSLTVSELYQVLGHLFGSIGNIFNRCGMLFVDFNQRNR